MRSILLIIKNICIEIKDKNKCGFFFNEEDSTLTIKFYDGGYTIYTQTLSKEDTGDLYKFLRDNYAISLRNNLGKDDSVSDNKNYE